MAERDVVILGIKARSLQWRPRRSIMFGFFKRWFSLKVQKQKCPGWKMVPATEVMDDGVHHQ
jgi:hypothetical protein